MPTVPNTTAPTAATTPGAAASAGSVLGKDDFLKLLVGQLQNQNPMDPMSNEDFMSQMSMFTLVEQTTNTAEATQQLIGLQAGQQAIQLLGKTVTYTDAESGEPASGVVEMVEWNLGVPSLTVSGVPGVAPEAVTAVE